MCFKNIILIAELVDSGELTFTETLKMCLVISSTVNLGYLWHLWSNKFL